MNPMAMYISGCKKTICDPLCSRFHKWRAFLNVFLQLEGMSQTLVLPYMKSQTSVLPNIKNQTLVLPYIKSQTVQCCSYKDVGMRGEVDT